MNEKVKELVEAAKCVLSPDEACNQWRRLKQAVEAVEHEAMAEMLRKLHDAMEGDADAMPTLYVETWPKSRDAFVAVIDAWFDLNKGR